MQPANGYAGFLKSIQSKWLQGLNSQAYLGTIGGTIDDQISQYKQAVKARFPGICPADALAPIGDERQLDRGPVEGDSSYAARLRTAWNIWPWAGKPVGLLVALHYAGFDGGIIVQQNGLYYQLDGDPDTSDYSSNLIIGDLGPNPLKDDHPWWTFDARDYFTSRYAILFPALPASFDQANAVEVSFDGTEDGSMAHPWPTATWPIAFASTGYHVATGGLTPLSGGPVAVSVINKTTTTCQVEASAPFVGTVDVIAWLTDPFLGLSDNDLGRLRSVIRKWGPAKGTCMGIFALIEGQFIGWPVRLISDSATIGGSAVQYYSAT